MRYLGSKHTLSAELVPFIKKALEVFPMGKYIEPFVGGANMIDKVNHHTRIGYDANPYLIALLKEAQAQSEALRYSGCISRDAHSYVKSNKEQFQQWYVGAMGLFPTRLNLWMAPYKQDRPVQRFSSAIKNLLKQNLNQIKLVNCDYKNIPIGKGNVIYCDPPYKSFDYYKMPFNHDEFYDWVRLASKNNIVLVSEYEMPGDFTCIWQKSVRPRINGRLGKKVEKLFICTQ